jgi:hypothetical protein
MLLREDKSIGSFRKKYRKERAGRLDKAGEFAYIHVKLTFLNLLHVGIRIVFINT